MSGLLKKDFYLMRSMGKSYLLVLAVFLVLSLAGIYTATFMTSFCALMCVMLPINVFAYDEQAKWDKYAAALPSGRAGVVQARYLFALIVGLAALALVTATQTALFYLGKSGERALLDALSAGLVPAAAGILMNAILIPLLFKFGAQKGRVYLMVVMGVCVGAIFGTMAVLSRLNIPLSAIAIPLSLLPILCVLSLLPSYFIALRIYRKKDL